MKCGDFKEAVLPIIHLKCTCSACSVAGCLKGFLCVTVRLFLCLYLKNSIHLISLPQIQMFSSSYAFLSTSCVFFFCCHYCLSCVNIFPCPEALLHLISLKMEGKKQKKQFYIILYGENHIFGCLCFLLSDSNQNVQWVGDSGLMNVLLWQIWK